ncbi:MAG: UDP-glucose 4-epimerase GalE [Candidatus Methanomethylophilus sp.]|jgi:UDP-glucose 4-epimerase|nr:UDP-glucose 4-epimerase GalE [Methanomethylophilus sp.]MCI2074467.1 UDP-glucose 4-epimerase GalE [Methanomethylophilus sp.]MCI2093866.1 UDP-glucose 4-epimerase GalE [Methanomethylophilus sp.]
MDTDSMKGTVMVTGGCGYIGSHCVLALLEKGYDVLAFDDFSTGHREISERLSEASGKCRGRFIGTFRGSLLEKDDLKKAMDGNRVDSVIHFAAYSQVKESVGEPSKYWRNNVCGTMNLLDAMKEHGVGKIVFSSTAAVYGEPESVPIKEDAPLRPINPYGNTKLTIERMMDDYGRAYGLRSVRLRYFNVAGADPQLRTGEWHEPETHLIPRILRSVAAGEPFRIFGTDYPTRDGTCVRDYVNVCDLADAHLLALSYLKEGGATDVFNLGTGNGSTVKEVHAACERALKMGIPVIEDSRREGDPAELIADSTKAGSILGWNPSRTLDDSIRTAWAWEKERKRLFG